MQYICVNIHFSGVMITSTRAWYQTFVLGTSMFLTGPLNQFLASTSHHSMIKPRPTPKATGA